MEAPAPLRKPLALVFCDISGFTRLMAREGDLVAFTVLREFREHTGRLGKEHHGLMIKFSADGFLAAFENVDDVMPLLISVENLLSKIPVLLDDHWGSSSAYITAVLYTSKLPMAAMFLATR